MFEGFNPTAAERRAIDTAFEWILGNTRDRYRSEGFCKQEKNGYGNPNDKVPVTAAKGLCVRWFLKGVEKPDWLLKESYWMRPAAIWFQGMGGEYSDKAPNTTALEAGNAAYKAAFDRMQKAA